MSGDPVSSTQSPNSQGCVDVSRRQREFIPEHKKDEKYWERRRKNNEAAKRSREKRRLNDVAMEGKIVELTQDNAKLERELMDLKKRFGLLPPDDMSHTPIPTEPPSQPPLLSPSSHPPAGPVPRLLPGPPNPFLPQSPRDLLALSRMVSPALFVPNQAPAPVSRSTTAASLAQPNLILQATASPPSTTSLAIAVAVPAVGVPDLEEMPLDLSCRTQPTPSVVPPTSSVQGLKEESNDLRSNLPAMAINLGKACKFVLKVDGALSPLFLSALSPGELSVLSINLACACLCARVHVFVPVYLSASPCPGMGQTAQRCVTSDMFR